MLRYRIARNPNGRHFVLPALASVVPFDETFATRAAAQDTADWLNRLHRDDPWAANSPQPPAPLAHPLLGAA